MEQYPSISRKEAIDKILRVLKVPLACMSKPDREEAIYYSQKYNINATEIIAQYHKNIMGA